MIKKYFAILCAFILIISLTPLSITVFAGNITTGICGYDVEDDDNPTVYYEYDNAAHVLNIKISNAQKGRMALNAHNCAASFPDGVEYVIIGDGIVNICAEAFANKTSLKTVELSDSVTEIESNAFEGCTSLESISTLENVTEIEPEAFIGCSALQNIELGSNLQSIGYSAFSNCVSLEAISIPDSVSKIDTHAFSGCTSLISVVTGNNVSSIEDYAFQNCSSLTDITWSSSLDSIGMFAFKGCASLRNVDLPDGLTKIKKQAFEGCTSIQNIEIPDTVIINSSADSAVFKGCSSLESAYIGSGVTYITRELFADCTSLSDVVINGSVKTMDYGAFKNTALAEIKIPDSVERLGGSFCDCASLESADLGSGVKTLVMNTFSGCSSLQSIRIPNTLTSIGADNFKGCTSLSKVYYSGTEEEWNNIEIESGNNCLTQSRIYYYDGNNCQHNYELTATVEPTCEDRGYCKYTCSLCGDTYKEPTSQPLGHAFGEYTVVKNATCTEPGYKVRTCSRCGKEDYADIYELGGSHIPSDWQMEVVPTVDSDGLLVQRCTKCGDVCAQISIPKLPADSPDGIRLSSSKEILLCGETAAITAEVTPGTAINKSVIWTSSDTVVASVENGLITANNPGAAVIIAETEDGGYKDFCLVQVFSVNARNGAHLDNESSMIYGLAPKLDSVDDFIVIDDESVSITYSSDVIGTGTSVLIRQNDTLIRSYQIVIFGDVNGDGIYDAQDATIVSCLANGLLTREKVGEAKYLAADCNHDGSVDSSDVLILEQAGLLLSQVAQTKEDYAETDAYEEYLELIDQNPNAEDIPETSEEPEIIHPTFIEKIIAFIKNIIEFIRSFAVKF